MQAFLFDFDGVIVDSERQWRKLGDEEFFPSLIPGWTKEDGAKMMGLGIEAGYKMLMREYGLHISYEQYTGKIGELVDDIYFAKLTLLPGLRELIERLERLHIKLAIGSSGNSAWINRVLNQFDLTKHFPVIVSAESVNNRTKPAPDIYLLDAERLGVDPGDCVVLEDSSNGIKAAKAAGMTCIAISTDMSALQDLSLADRVVKHYDELSEDMLTSL